MTMGDEVLSQVVSSSSSSGGLFAYQHPYTNYSNINNNVLHNNNNNNSNSNSSSPMNNSPMNHGKILSNYGVQGSMVVRHSGQMAAPSFTVLAGLSVQSSATSPDHHSLPSSDIGEVDLDLWDLDINAPSVISNSSGGLSPAVPPGRRSSSTSSTSG